MLTLWSNFRPGAKSQSLPLCSKAEGTAPWERSKGQWPMATKIFMLKFRPVVTARLRRKLSAPRYAVPSQVRRSRLPFLLQLHATPFRHQNLPGPGQLFISAQHREPEVKVAGLGPHLRYSRPTGLQREERKMQLMTKTRVLLKGH